MCRSHWEGTVTECWTSGGRYHQHGWVSRPQTTSSVDVRCPVQALSKVRRCCSMKTAVGQNAQPEGDSLWNSQPTEFTNQWGYASWPPRWVNQTGGGIEDGLQPVLQLAGDTSENRVAVVHLADNQATVHSVLPVLACGTVCRHQRRMHLHCLYLAGCSNTKLSVIVTSPTCANLSLTDVLFPHNRLVNLLTLYSVLALL